MSKSRENDRMFAIGPGKKAKKPIDVQALNALYADEAGKNGGLIVRRLPYNLRVFFGRPNQVISAADADHTIAATNFQQGDGYRFTHMLSRVQQYRILRDLRNGKSKSFPDFDPTPNDIA